MIKKCVFILLFIATDIYAYSGQDLLIDCQRAIKMAEATGKEQENLINPENVISQRTCISYVRGATDMYELYSTILSSRINENSDATKINYKLYCSPKDVTYLQIMKIIIHFMENNPDSLHKEANYIIALALALSFPCNGQ